MGKAGIRWKPYESPGFFDELIKGKGRIRYGARPLCRYLSRLSIEEVGHRKAAAELAIHTMGITFTVYSDKTGSIDREWPFDIIPRIIPRPEWERIREGLTQRVRALNLFIDDLYHGQKIVKDRIFPEAVLRESRNFREICMGVKPPLGVWAHICGSDLVRDRDGTMYVLEDNLRVPSGVSYMLENRQIMKRVFPEMFEAYDIDPVDDYALQLQQCLASLSPRSIRNPEIVVLTPGIYNSAYFEHSYLAQQMGAELVEGIDLFVGDDDVAHRRSVRIGLDGPDLVEVLEGVADGERVVTAGASLLSDGARVRVVGGDAPASEG